jgi:glycosyltransferase involved in cell wall biosynthesis
MDKVTVVIPSYNRFYQLLIAIESIQKQTYKNLEIIVVNDCSTEKEYYKYPFEEKNIKIIHLEKNSKDIYGFGCPQRNHGMKIATGKFIAFCDDDDLWFPRKIELQIEAMKRSGCKMSCSEGLIGHGIYNENICYKRYNGEHYYKTLQNIYRSKGSSLLDNGFPEIWNYEFVDIHNCLITSSVIIEKEIIDQTGEFIVCSYAEDYDYWKRALKYTNIVYVNDICFYYDN